MERSEDGFREIYEANAGRVFAYALRRTSRQEANDVVADTFLVAWKKWRDVPDDPLPWLLAVARNVVANRNRSQRRRTRLDIRLQHEAGRERDVPDHATTSAERREIAEALGRLRPWDQEALRLVAWDGLDQKEAAQAMGCSPSTFAVRLHRARRRLEAELGGIREKTAGQLAKETR